MSAKTPLLFARENRLEKRSQRAIEAHLDPWRISWIDTRDDIGRDAFVQFARANPDGSATALPEACALQAKSTAGELAEDVAVSIETRHLALWTSDLAIPMLLGLWSSRSDELRIRTAKELLEEVAISSPGWETQGTVTVHLRASHSIPHARSLDDLKRLVTDELDTLGGVQRRNKVLRRVLLSHLFINGLETSHTLTLDSLEGSQLTCHIGSGYDGREITREDSNAQLVLRGCLLLYEQTWIPLQLAGVVARLLGARNVHRLVDAGRLKFLAPAAYTGFICEIGKVSGDLRWFALSDDQVQHAKGWCQQVEQNVRQPGVAKAILDGVQLIPHESIQRALAGAEHDLSRGDIRGALGLGKETSPKAPWDFELYNRILELNLWEICSAQNAIDVVEYETGMSRLAAMRLSPLEFDRQHHTLEALDRGLAFSEMPDLDIVLRAIPTDKLIDIVLDKAAQEFRDWYWEYCASSWSNSARQGQELLATVARIVGVDRRTKALGSLLYFAYLSSVKGQYMLLSTPTRTSRGYVRRTRATERALTQQRRVHAGRRQLRIRRHLDRDPTPYEPCPCGSSEKYKFCCGRS